MWILLHLVVLFVNVVPSNCNNNKLVAPDGAYNDQFGISMSMYNDYLVVGAYQDDDKGGNSGTYINVLYCVLYIHIILC